MVMKPSSRIRLTAALLGAAGVATMLTTLGSAASPKFYPDDPVWIERDTENAAGIKPLDVNLFVDFAYNVITGMGKIQPVRAKNVNTVDEVPDSSWYTNRAGARLISPEEMKAGPNTDDGPAPGTWTVTSSKSDGVTPGLTIRDAKGQRWFLKFDPPGFRGMSTGTEVAGTKLMWALGYNVPQNHIAYMQREQLVVGEGAKYTPFGGRPRRMRVSDIDELLKRADRESTGLYRIVASKALEGQPIGRIRFLGTRPDDPNDLIAHEHRRELRGYGTFAAWLNHVDTKAINSLDTLVTENGRSFVKHHLIDFGSAMGSGAVEPAEYWSGSHYLIEPKATGKRMIGFGFVFPEYHTTPYYEAPAIGRFRKDNTAFDAESWKPREPNRAFINARLDDKFWAAQKLMALSTDLIRAAVESADYGDDISEEFLIQALAERRDAIGRRYLTAINPIADPALSASGRLTFRNAAVDADFARVPASYRATWSRFDNTTGEATVFAETIAVTPELQAPSLPGAEGAFIKVALSADSAAFPSWAEPVHAYFQRTGGAWRLVGFERMPDAAVAAPVLTN
jgi:hypothetical protein